MDSPDPLCCVGVSSIADCALVQPRNRNMAIDL